MCAHPLGPLGAMWLGQLPIMVQRGATHSLDIRQDPLLGRLRSTDGHNLDLTPRMLRRTCMRPREELAQHIGDVVDNLLDCHVWVHELQIEDDTVIMSHGNTLE